METKQVYKYIIERRLRRSGGKSQRRKSYTTRIEGIIIYRERAGYCPLRRMHCRIKGFCAMDERWRRNNALALSLFRPFQFFFPPTLAPIVHRFSSLQHIYSLSENRFDSCLANESTFPPNRQNKSSPSYNRPMIS